ncbi:hypothetical protein [Rhizobium leguminosarum]|uniref:hypothetical protein n=1 Tax=Rhizobium leguminosarum TaxID=384 RepID=UPI00103D2F2D|nr:hypothetical protein [Rhizobium leguminosarum]TBZ05671.1 hypothetical protein E0H33_34200 [Rhizobium leguminosarum bv. viciae]
MKVTDATVDRIQQRREKLERKGVIKEKIAGSDVAFHLWQADENGLVTRSGEHEGPGIQCVVIPSGKFIVPESKIVPAMTEEQWITGFAHLEELPEMPMRVSPLIDAPSPPEEIIPPCDIERVPDATIATGGEPNAHDRPLAIRPDQIDRKAVLLDLEAHRQKRATPPVPTPKPKARTLQERTQQIKEEMLAQFEADRLAQQRQETKAPLNMAMAPTIKDWKGY